MPDSVSDSEYESDSCDVSEFLKAFPTYHLHKKPEFYFENLYVFDRQDEGGGSQNNSSSAHRQTTGTIQDKIKSALSSTEAIYVDDLFILQFWAPVENGGRRLLSTSDQPFAVNILDNDLIKYRQQCTEYEYGMVVNYRQDGEEDEHSNPSGPPATAFLNRLPLIVDISKNTRGTLTQYALESDLLYSFMLPICCPSQTSSPCVGVIEFSSSYNGLVSYQLRWINDKLKKEGLSIFDVQERIPYKILHGLRPVRDKISYAIETLCKSHKLLLAQVWIGHHEDKNQVPFLSSFEYAQKKHMLALKLTGYYDPDLPYETIPLKEYYSLCDMFPLDTGESLVEKTLQDYKSRFYTTYDRLNKNQKKLADYDHTNVNGIVIWLKSIDTRDFGYAFEFFWIVKSDYDFSLEDLLLALKGLLASFKFASTAELGDELHVIDVENSTESDIRSLKIFEGKGISIMTKAPEEGKKQVVVKDITHLEMNCESAPIDVHGEDIELQIEKTQKEAAKNLEDVGNSIKRDSKRKKPAVVEDEESLKAKKKTAPKELPYAKIEKRFGKTQSEAATDLDVSLSTLKRRCKKYGIYDWPGPRKPGKKKVNHFRNQSGTIEEDTGAILVPLYLERNENNLTIKAEDSNGSNDMIRFELPMSEVTFKSVEKEIVKEFELIPGTYKIKYCDKEEDWILLTPNCDMNYCIRSSKDSHKNIIRLRVQRVSPSS